MKNDSAVSNAIFDDYWDHRGAATPEHLERLRRVIENCNCDGAPIDCDGFTCIDVGPLLNLIRHLQQDA